MAEIVLSTEEVSVLGGPASVEVELDFGPTGARGSRIYAGIGKPASAGLSPNLFDMYINYKSDDDEYSFMYQYLNQDGIDQWVKLVRLIPDAYSSRPTETFTAGSAVIDIPVHQLLGEISGGSPTPDNFAVQVSFSGANPVAHSIEYPVALTTSGDYSFLSLTINAAEYSGGSWSALSGDNEFSISVTVV